MSLRLEVLELDLAVCRLEAAAAIPDAIQTSKFLSITKTPEELSIVCESSAAIGRIQSGWKAFRVAGTLDFSLTGILSSITAPLAEAKISLFAISTFDTDYILIRAHELERATEVLRNAGFEL